MSSSKKDSSLPTTSAFSLRRWRTRLREVDDSLDAIGWQERVAVNLVRVLSDAVHTAGTLNQPDDGPRQVVVDDNSAVLKVLALAQHVRGNQNPKFVFGLDRPRVSCCFRG